jgi:hypothetical protein
MQLHETVTANAWLNEQLFPTRDTSKAERERERHALVGQYRSFLASVQLVDVSVTDIGGSGWKATKSTAGYVLRRQQEMYKRLCARRDALAG